MHCYKTFMLSDEPKIAGIPIVTGIPVFFLTTIGLLIGYGPVLFVIGASLSIFMHFKFGALSLRLIFAICYWSFPPTMTQFIFRAFPNSAHRRYVR